VDDVEAGGGREDGGRGGRPEREPPGVRGPVHRRVVEREEVPLAEPAGDGGLQPGCEVSPHVQEGDARPAQQVLERAADDGVDAEGPDVEGHHAGAVVVVEHAQRPGGPAPVHERGGVEQ
jgi:hypothetical protein